MRTNLSVARGRPRIFDLEAALGVGQRMFHAYGYNGVSLAALTDALGVKPPSFYAAFGSKAAFFGQVVERYVRSTLSLTDILVPGRPPEQALADLLELSARAYASDPELRGCLVLEATRENSDEEWVKPARICAEQRRVQIRDFIALSQPDIADAVMDYVGSVMSGLSASAREGMSEQRLLGVAQAAASGLRSLIYGST